METRSLALLALCVAACAEPLSEAEALAPLQRTIKSRSDAFSTYANEFTQDYEPVAYAAIPLTGPMPVVAILSDNPLSPGKQFGHQSLASTLKQIYSKPEYHKYSKPEHQQYSKPEYQQYSKPEYQQYSKPEYQQYSKPDYQQNYIQTEYQYTKPYEEYQKPYADYPKYPQYAPTKYPSIEYPKHYSSIEFAKPYPPVEYPKYPVEYAKPYPVEYAKPYAQEYAPYRAVEYTKPYQEEYVKPYASAEAPTILYARPSENGGYTYSRRPLKKRNMKRPRKTQKPMIIRVHKYRVIRSRRSGP